MSARVRTGLRLLAPVLAVVTVAVIGRADAPPGQYQSFNRSDTVILDLHTNLQWQRDVTAFTDFPGALATCSALSLGGEITGWRLPSYKELLTLVDEMPHDEYPTGAPQQIAIDGNAFPGTPVDGYFWTSSISPVGGDVYVVKFDQGEASKLPQSASKAYVRCVHNGM